MTRIPTTRPDTRRALVKAAIAFFEEGGHVPVDWTTTEWIDFAAEAQGALIATSRALGLGPR